jgi:hypothetical protein
MLWRFGIIFDHLQGQSFRSSIYDETAEYVQTLLPQVAYTLSEAINQPLATDSILLAPEFWLIAIMLVIVPLSFLRTLDSLRFTSQIALSTVV